MGKGDKDGSRTGQDRHWVVFLHPRPPDSSHRRFWFRLYWFPLKVLYATCHCSLREVPDIPFYFFFNALLLLLTLMNLYWFLVSRPQPSSTVAVPSLSPSLSPPQAGPERGTLGGRQPVWRAWDRSTRLSAGRW